MLTSGILNGQGFEMDETLLLEMWKVSQTKEDLQTYRLCGSKEPGVPFLAFYQDRSEF